jgi:hypothetical protein
MAGMTRKRLAGIVAILTMTFLIPATMSSAGGGPILHRVSVGGPDNCAGIGGPPGCDANFSLVAVEYADGSAAGRFIDRSGSSNGWVAVIDCLVVDGTDAWVSGVITHGTNVDLPVIARVRDNGTSALDPPDQISFSLVGDSTSCTAKPDLPLFDMPQGQVIVD